MSHLLQHFYNDTVVHGLSIIPSHPTPASSACWQLWFKIGLLEHSSSWLELEVHWTSSRKIGPVPEPKCALLYAMPPTNIGKLNQLA